MTVRVENPAFEKGRRNRVATILDQLREGGDDALGVARATGISNAKHCTMDDTRAATRSTARVAPVEGLLQTFKVLRRFESGEDEQEEVQQVPRTTRPSAAPAGMLYRRGMARGLEREAMEGAKRPDVNASPF